MKKRTSHEVVASVLAVDTNHRVSESWTAMCAGQRTMRLCRDIGQQTFLSNQSIPPFLLHAAAYALALSDASSKPWRLG